MTSRVRQGILFRVDASPRIGAGHAMRCLALAEAFLRLGWRVVFAARQMLPMVNGELSRRRIPVVRLPAGAAAERAALVRAVRRFRAETMLLDGYQFGAAYQRRMCGVAEQLAWITDYPAPAAADLVVSATPELRVDDFPAPDETQVLLGPRYLLLRNEILAARQPRKRQPGMRIVVCLGGSYHERKVWLRLLGAIDRSVSGAKISILTGSNPPAYFEALLPAAGRNRYRLVTPAEFSPRLLTNASLGVVSASTVMWELAAFGVPVAAGVVADNQAGNAQWLGARYGFSLGDLRRQSLPMLSARMRRVFRRRQRWPALAARTQALIDGRGKERIAAIIAGRPGALQFTPVTAEDCEFLWKLRNQPEVRQGSFNTRPIPYAGHLAWFEQKLASPDTRIFIIRAAGRRRVGYVRYDRNAAGVAEIDVAMRSRARGRRWGAHAVRVTSLRLLRAGWVRRITALIKLENRYSLRVFSAAGFVGATRVRHAGQSCARMFFEVRK